MQLIIIKHKRKKGKQKHQTQVTTKIKQEMRSITKWGNRAHERT